MNRVFAIIVAAGRSERFAGNSPKQFSHIDGDIVIRKVVRLFLSQPHVSGVICIIPENAAEIYNDVFNGFSDERLLKPVYGGNSRQESVKNGLDALYDFNPDYVLVHDAARCYVNGGTINSVIRSLGDGNKAVVPTVKPIDSVRYFNKQVNRDDIDLVQTPQGFCYDLIHRLHEKYAGKNASDDASLCDFEDIKVTLVNGDFSNKKLTFEGEVSKPRVKIGFGFDAHAFSTSADCKLYLMGVLLSGCPGLDGVSDADVGIHSVVDAIIGALGLGSIGEHFPASDGTWRDADSKTFLKYCAELLRHHGYKLLNIDTTIVCEEPNISSHSLKMKQVIATCLNIAPGVVNIKGKTTEGMGFEGRKEGISAYSNVLIEKV